MRKFRTLAFSSMLAAVLIVFSAGAAMAQDQRVSIPSNKSFQQTVDAFKMAVSKGGMMIMSTVDQGNMLKMTGLELKGTLFLVGNPNVGKQVFEHNPAAGPCACTSIRARTAGLISATTSRRLCSSPSITLASTRPRACSTRNSTC
jgi:hypothetical protein